MSIDKYPQQPVRNAFCHKLTNFLTHIEELAASTLVLKIGILIPLSSAEDFETDFRMMNARTAFPIPAGIQIHICAVPVLVTMLSR